MDNIKKFEDFLSKMQGLLGEAKKQGHIIIRVEDLENAFPEIMESDDKNKPNGGIVMEDFKEGNGSYKVNLAYLNEEQVKEIEELAKKWNPELKESEDERIRKRLIDFFEDWGENRSHCWGIAVSKILAWLEKQDSQILANSAITCKDEPFDYDNANIQQKDFAPKADMPRYSIGDVLCDKSCTTLGKEEQSNFEITDIRNGMYICDKCSFPISQQDEYELVAKRIEQNSAWSKEDERICYAIICDISNDKSICKFEISKSICDEQINWLKSLKQRIERR